MNPSFKSDIKICILRRFYNETSAKMVQSRLEESGVESFISNSITSTLLPFSEGGFILHVRNDDLLRAEAILNEWDNELQDTSRGDFKNADLEDIYYEKAVWDYDQKLTNSSERRAWLLLLLVFLAFAILVLLNRAIQSDAYQ